MIKVTPQVDYEFALQLSRSNMAAYYTRHGFVWDDAYFARFWDAAENFGVYQDGQCVGLVRMRLEADAMHLSDLQVMPEHQGAGIGAAALQYMMQLAKVRRKPFMRLAVFVDNPARRFYERHGFAVVEQEGALCKMACTLGGS
jgi:ribosomal protein S18 acetylase RimI-like enzyme